MDEPAIPRIDWDHISRTEVDDLAGWCRAVVDALGIKGAMLTDRSAIGDFAHADFDHKAGGIDEVAWRNRLDRARKRLGIEIDEDDLVHEVARRAMLGQGSA